ncbi:immunity 42 family protein [Yersinia wautersii]|uniref:immunity 42 family protein n=1 Tax=Yersinia wautersii TaxID=1341643 RepID=UPI00041CB409|nr:immunity 42 family protein [Yersinia wautersii]
MIFGDPYRFAIWVECIPQWSDSYKNGFFYFFVNGNMYPDDIRTSTLFIDFYDVLDEKNALISLPCNDEIFNAPTNEAFDSLFKLAYPESTQDDEYPDQVFDFYASSTIINDSGAYFFAVSNESLVRIIGGKITKLVDRNNEKVWENIDRPLIEDITIPKNEISDIITRLKEYSTSLF